MKITNTQRVKGIGSVLTGLLLLAFISLSPSYHSQGEALFKAKCATCHAVFQNGTGPKLYGAVERWEAEGEGEAKAAVAVEEEAEAKEVEAGAKEVDAEAKVVVPDMPDVPEKAPDLPDAPLGEGTNALAGKTETETETEGEMEAVAA